MPALPTGYSFSGAKLHAPEAYYAHRSKPGDHMGPQSTCFGAVAILPTAAYGQFCCSRASYHQLIQRHFGGMSTRCLPKQGRKPLQIQGFWPPSSFFCERCLPNVYQDHFFETISPVFHGFSLFGGTPLTLQGSLYAPIFRFLPEFGGLW